MSGQELFERIFESLHEAVLDDAHWPATAGLIDEAIGSKGNFLVFGERRSRDDVEILFKRFCYRGERNEYHERLYYDAYHSRDERIPRFRLLPDSRLVHVAELYTDQERKTSPAFNEAMPLGETQNGLNVRLDGPDGSHIGWQAADPVDGDGWSSAQVETIERLLPHIRQFVRVRQSLVSARALGSSVTRLLDSTRFGVIQLDRRGRIMAANDRARDILRKSDGLSDRGGLLCASTPAGDAALQKILNRALPRFGGQGASGTMMVKRSVVSPGLVLHTMPVSDERTDMHPRGVAALVLVVDPASRARIDPALVGTLLGLTPAESHVAVMLAQGYTIRQIAIETGRSEGTIRWHIKHIFGKLGVSRQVDLVQLVMSLGDLP
ncbi:MAG: LuxR C-terminal-related transcriptional regulator, partial [Rhodospirillales bacterium]|nr:LuxR C-terminal-related transcriptional regulator [Rhodospirillales bacterium]